MPSAPLAEIAAASRPPAAPAMGAPTMGTARSNREVSGVRMIFSLCFLVGVRGRMLGGGLVAEHTDITRRSTRKWPAGSGPPAAPPPRSRPAGIAAWWRSGDGVSQGGLCGDRGENEGDAGDEGQGGGGGRPGEPEPAATEPGTGEGRGGREGKVGADGVEQPADDGLEEERPREHADDRAELGSDEGTEPNADGRQ